MSLATRPASPALLQLLRELSTLRLPSRDGLTDAAWLFACRDVLSREQWARLAAAVLA
jgi:hypothetical protein